MSSLSEIESAMIAQTDNLLPEVKEELSFTVKQAETNISVSYSQLQPRQRWLLP